MAIITSITTGNVIWRAGSSWVGGVVPIPGVDTVVIAFGCTMTIDIDLSGSIGNAPATDTTVLTVSGSLVVSAGVTITVAGGILVNNNAVFTLQQGVTLRFNGTVAYRLLLAGTGKLVCNGGANSGATVNRVTIGISGTAKWALSYSGSNSGQMECYYTTFEDASYSNIYSLQLYIGTGKRNWLIHCHFVRCHKVYVIELNAAGSWRFNSAKFSDSLSETTFSSTRNVRILTHTGTPTAEREFIGNVFDFPVQMQNVEAWVIEDNSFYSRAGMAGSGSLFVDHATAPGTSASVLNNLYYSEDIACTLVWGAWGLFDRGYHIQAIGDNPHFVNGYGNVSVSGSATFKNQIFESLGSTGTGDCYLLGRNNPPAPITWDILNNIVLPDGGGDNTGTLISQLKTLPMNYTYNIQHNTVMVGSQAGAAVSEGAGVAKSGLCNFSYNLNYDYNKDGTGNYVPRGYKTRRTGGSDGSADASANATGGATTSLTLNSLGWPTDYLVNAGIFIIVLENTAKFGTDNVRTVSANTSTSVSWTTPLTAAVSAGDAFHIRCVGMVTADYNCGFNVLDGVQYTPLDASVNGHGYSNECSDVELGVHDINIDPRFVNPDACISNWAAHLGKTGTRNELNASALAEIRKQCDDEGYDSRFNISDLITYIQEAFRPRATNLFANGQYIGAMPVKGVNIWDGTQWVEKNLWLWDGTDWQLAAYRTYDGATW